VPSTARGLDVNVVPNSNQLTMVSSSPWSRRARISRSRRSIQRGHAAFDLRRRQRVEVDWKRACQLRQDRAGFTEADESGWTDRRRRPQYSARCDQEQDTDNPSVTSRSAPILTVLDTVHLPADDFSW
jgi:hypothetical protein